MDLILLVLIVVIVVGVVAWLIQPKCAVCGHRFARGSVECPKGHRQG